MDNNSENKSKTIGIITFHRYSNPGTVLQALALQDKIEEYGYHVELIDFEARISETRLENFTNHIRRIPVYIKDFKKYYYQFVYRDNIKLKQTLSNSFHDNTIHVGNNKYYSTEQLCENPPVYDGYIVGSDQTWNPNVSHNPDAFYLTFVEDSDRCGSYAPSVASSRLTNAQEQRMCSLLPHIRWLSCRERSGAEKIEKLTGRMVKTVLDPTLLLDMEQWEKYTKPVKVYKPYILQYILGESKEHRDYVRNISQKLNMPIINISTTFLDWKENNVLICGPDEFLWLIKNASLVCTDSFHGTAFSLNLNVPFVSFERYSRDNAKSENTRLYDLLNSIGLESRIVDANTSIDIFDIDFSNAMTRLLKLREESEEYLKKMLLSITGC